MSIIVKEEHRKGVFLSSKEKHKVELKFLTLNTYRQYNDIFRIYGKFDLFIINKFNMDLKKYSYYKNCTILERRDGIAIENTVIVFEFETIGIINESELIKFERKEKLNKLNV